MVRRRAAPTNSGGVVLLLPQATLVVARRARLVLHDLPPAAARAARPGHAHQGSADVTRAELLRLRERAWELDARARDFRRAGLERFAAEAAAQARRLYAELVRDARGRPWCLAATVAQNRDAAPPENRKAVDGRGRDADAAPLGSPHPAAPEPGTVN